jgi:hypothetical protein
MSGNPVRAADSAGRTDGPRPARLASYALSEEDVYRLAERGRLHAVLDAADAPEVLEVIVADGVTTIELFSPDADPLLGFMAPYLVPLDEVLLARLRETVWRSEWGLLIEAEVPSAVLKQHLRRFLLVEHPDGKTVYFRMYDPRVLRRFLPNCTGAELAALFGSITAYIVPDGIAGARFTRYALEAGDFDGLASNSAVSRSADQLAPRFTLRAAHLGGFGPVQ